MLNHRTAGIYVIILAVAGFLLMIVNIQFGWLLAALAAVYLCLLVMGAVKICAGFYLEVFCRGNSGEKSVALTFDDGPDPEHTPQILAILAKHQVHATFFIIGEKAENQQEIVRQTITGGHSLGNHSYSHAFLFDLYGRKKMERDLLKADEVISKATGKKPVFFRPPYGVTNPTLAGVVKKLGYIAAGWSVRSLDTVLKDEEKLMERIIDRLHPGAVILMHDDRAVTARVLEKIINKIKEEGYIFVGLEEMINKTNAHN
jgi:peptidoglycan/xylan/chitin deacetylase (PgdA/CDA1 family)